MRNRLGELGWTLWIMFLIIVCFAILAFAALGIQKYAYPWMLSIQRRSVENSKSFTDSNNNMLAQYMLEYSRLDTKIAEAHKVEDSNSEVVYKSQQLAIKSKMCTQISTMQKDTINPDTLLWLNQHGGCR